MCTHLQPQHFFTLLLWVAVLSFSSPDDSVFSACTTLTSPAKHGDHEFATLSREANSYRVAGINTAHLYAAVNQESLRACKALATLEPNFIVQA